MSEAVESEEAVEAVWGDPVEATREQELQAMGLREVEVDLLAEGQAIAAVLGTLNALPDYSQHRVLEAVTRLVLPAVEKSSFQQLAEVSQGD